MPATLVPNGGWQSAVLGLILVGSVLVLLLVFKGAKLHPLPTTTPAPPSVAPSSAHAAAARTAAPHAAAVPTAWPMAAAEPASPGTPSTPPQIVPAPGSSPATSPDVTERRRARRTPKDEGSAVARLLFQQYDRNDSGTIDAVELKALCARSYGLEAADVDVAVVGLRVASEHEDACCATIELRGAAEAKQAEIEGGFLELARREASKGARPDHVRVAPLPRNFKGVVKLPDLKEHWTSALKP